MELFLSCVGADLHRVATVEEQHERPFWSIGQGFEGSPSDYTEYFVWLIGVIGVFYYMTNPNARQNLHAADDNTPINAGQDDDWMEGPGSDAADKSKKKKRKGKKP